IATQVFKRGDDFDPSQDAMVRVYAHHLRQKLDNFYGTAGRDETARLVIPKGEYRVAVATPEPAGSAPEASEPRARRLRPLIASLAALALVAVGVAIGWSLRPAVPEAAAPVQAIAASTIWSPLFDDS